MTATSSSRPPPNLLTISLTITSATGSLRTPGWCSTIGSTTKRSNLTPTEWIRSGINRGSGAIKRRGKWAIRYARWAEEPTAEYEYLTPNPQPPYFKSYPICVLPLDDVLATNRDGLGVLAIALTSYTGV